jgi:adenine-specific DNA-methyltransferase
MREARGNNMMKTLTYDEMVPLNKILQVRIIGSKYKMLENILKIIQKEGITGKTFFDVFCGSTSVGRFFKRRFLITSNDILYFSYVLQKALIDLNSYPKFGGLNFIANENEEDKERVSKVLDYLNNIKGSKGFIYQHYTPASKIGDGVERKYFSELNGEKIDAVRAKIEKWFTNKNITEDEYFYLIASLLLAVQKVSNISGTYGTYNKIWDARAKKTLKLQVIEIIDSKFEHKAFNDDSLKLLSKINCDIAYVDPPYNSRQYISNYHILETIAKYDNPTINGKSGMRGYNGEKSTFCSSKTAKRDLLKLLSELRAKHIILSYNSEGLLSKDELKEICEKSKLENIKIYEFPYRRFKSNDNGNANHNEVMEYIFTGKKRGLVKV